MASKSPKKSEMRIVVVQTSRGFSPEVDVFASLVKNINSHAQERNYTVKILLIPGD